MQAAFDMKKEGLSRLYDRKLLQSCTTSLVLVNAAANHIAGSDRCLPNRELPHIFQTLALASWFTLLLKWETKHS